MTDPAPEVLVLGRPRPSRKRLRLSRTSVLLLSATLVLLVVAGVVIDHRVRSSEAAAVGGCAADAREAIHSVQEQVAGTIAYVRPVWAYKTPPEVRKGLNHMVSKAATGTDVTLTDERRRCAAVQVVALHEELGDRQAACVRLLDRYAEFLRSVVDQGSRGFGPWPALDPAC